MLPPLTFPSCHPGQKGSFGQASNSQTPTQQIRQVSSPEPCPLCRTPNPDFYCQDRWRPYWRCRICLLVFVPQESRLSGPDEKARYDQHQNDPSDLRYRHFLSRLANPLLDRVPKGSIGLDFGSGPGPTLGPMLVEAGLTVHLYDPFYAQDPEVWNRRYDFITASEVIEHLHTPNLEFKQLFSVLASKGYLAVMTRWVEDRDSFINSRYSRDPTHVCFYSLTTCKWIAHRWRSSLEIPKKGIALFRSRR